MSIVFAVRGDSVDARYSNAGKAPAILGPNDPPEVTTDEPGINGSTSIDMAGSFLTFRCLNYIGRENTPSGLARSMLCRVKFVSLAATQALCFMGDHVRDPINFLGLNVTTTPEVNALVSNNATQTDDGTTTSSGIGTTNWHDIFVSWTGDTTSGGLKIFVDGVQKLSDTMTRSLASPYTNDERLICGNVGVGAHYSYKNTHYYLDEFVVWDSIVDPTSVALTSGTGSLNGSSRTAYVDVSSYDGMAQTGSPVSINTGQFGL